VLTLKAEEGDNLHNLFHCLLPSKQFTNQKEEEKGRLQFFSRFFFYRNISNLGEEVVVLARTKYVLLLRE
jgi:hypothetical protein